MKRFLFFAVFAFWGIVGQAQLASDYFITKWNTGSATTLTLRATGSYNVLWEKADDPSVNGSETYTGITLTTHPTINFGSPGTYVVKIVKSGTSPFTFFNVASGVTPYPEATKLIEVQQWGTNNWTVVALMFNGCSNMDITATDTPNFSGATGSMNLMFQNCTNLKGENADFSNWDVSNASTMISMFQGATQFNRPLTNWSPQKVTNFSNMFRGATAFNQPLNSWNISAGTSINSMFRDAAAFNQPLDNWNTSKVTNMTGVFWGATAFNQSLADWNLKSVSGTSNFVDLFRNSSMDCVNYDLTLIGWANNPETPSGITFTNNAVAPVYSSSIAVAARNTLIKTKGWTITGDNYDADCNPTTASSTSLSDVFMNVSVHGKSVVVNNVEKGDILQLIGISGNIIFSQQAENNEITFDVSRTGVYIVKNATQNKCLKVLII